MKLFCIDTSSPFWKRDLVHKLLLVPVSAGWFWLAGTTIIPKQPRKAQPIATISIGLLSFGYWRRSMQGYHALVERRATLLPKSFWICHTGAYGLSCSLLAGSFWPSTLGLSVTWWLSGKTWDFLDRKMPTAQGFAGRVVKPFNWVKRYYSLMQDKDDPGYAFGGLMLPPSQVVQNTLLLGGVGSGKTISLRLYLQSVLPRIAKGSSLRAIVYDPKRDMPSILHGINPNCPIWITNPFDARHVAPDLSSVLITPTHARNLAATLAPKNPNDKDPIWVNMTQLMLEGITLYFILNAPGKWTLRDIILGTESIERLRKILASDPRTQGYLLPLQGEKLTHSVMVNVLTYLAEFKVIAALWEHAAYTIDLAAFLQSEGILVLPRDEECETAVNALNRLIMMRLTQMLLNGEETDKPHTFFILDEFTSMGAIPKFKTLATNGRSKGVALTLAFQSYPDLVDTYNREIADTIAEQFWNKCILRVNGAATANWASEMVGDVERIRRKATTDDTLVNTESLEKVQAVLPADFMTLPPPNIALKQGVTGYCLGHWAYQYTLPSETISRQMVPRDQHFADFIPQPVEHQYLHPWDAEDLARLNLTDVLGDDPGIASRSLLQPAPGKPRILEAAVPPTIVMADDDQQID